MNPIFFTAFIVIIDQLSKFIARSNMNLYSPSIELLGNFFKFTYVENSGIAFGINFNNGPIVFTILASIATIFIIWYLFKSKKESYLFRLSLSFILGGAIGNLIDRYLFGKVVDFFHLSIGQFSWPVFNVADSFVTIGMALYIYSIYIDEKSQSTLNEKN
tara:strand:+ start:35043 stop:35522 length:480 start_codon:yes stop_codon:yes gene_type:complete